MQLEIVSPERVLLNTEVSIVTVPGVDGEFQMLDNHAPIVSVLEKGYIRFQPKGDLSDAEKDNFFKGNGDKQLSMEIKGGVVEMKNNKAIILVD